MANAAILDTRERVYAGIVLTSLAYLLFSPQDARFDAAADRVLSAALL
jgi:hypothetical protein